MTAKRRFTGTEARAYEPRSRGAKGRPLRALLGLGALALALSVAGCLVALDDDGAEQIRVSLESVDQTPIRILVSADFRVGTVEDGFGLELGQADTIVTSFPFDATFDIRERRRFFLDVLNSDSLQENVRVRAWLDGDERLNTAVPPGPIQIYYAFNENLPGGAGDLVVF